MAKIYKKLKDIKESSSIVQDYIEEKSNEISMGSELIKKLDLTNVFLLQKH